VEYKCGEYGDSRFHHKNTMIMDTKPNTPDSREKIESARFCGIQMWRRWRFHHKNTAMMAHSSKQTPTCELARHTNLFVLVVLLH
jgi:hypothetical protein